MFKTNAQIVWDQMMNGLKTHSQNFTVENVLKRLGRPTSSEEYVYTAKYDDGTAAALIAAVNRATNPTLKTTNVKTLRKIQAQIEGSSLATSPLYANDPNNPNNPNDLTALVTLADAYNDAELQAVTADPATLGWNAAKQTESTVLYMNRFATKEGVSKNIGSELEALAPGDIIIITIASARFVNNRKQKWLVTGKPQPQTNPNYPNVIDIPVENEITRFSVLVDNNIPNDTQLKVELERFTDDEIYSGGTRGAIGGGGVAPAAPALGGAAAAAPAPAPAPAPQINVVFPLTMIKTRNGTSSSDQGTYNCVRPNNNVPLDIQILSSVATPPLEITTDNSRIGVTSSKQLHVMANSIGECLITIKQLSTIVQFTLNIVPGLLIAEPKSITSGQSVNLTPYFYTQPSNLQFTKIGTTNQSFQEKRFSIPPLLIQLII